eukprot:TRINITY_DN4329_c0_g1_i10.p1 TRINITY_DN4329_c0_g1~~TRINITY_DN4329_c0_g1_i10.p1  ORF type:complete len:460 (-),score=128.56 TRINITY_DN4329_c0_g1_i10:359-1738(-)
MVGTPYYLSPEIIENKPYSFKSDIWSLGVILYELCALRPPFDGDSLHHLALKIVKGTYSPIPSQYSRELKNLITSMLSLDAARRPTINQILKQPIITNRIKCFLSDSLMRNEFSHTILHKQNIFEKGRREPERYPPNDYQRGGYYQYENRNVNVPAFNAIGKIPPPASNLPFAPRNVPGQPSPLLNIERPLANFLSPKEGNLPKSPFKVQPSNGIGLAKEPSRPRLGQLQPVPPRQDMRSPFQLPNIDRCISPIHAAPAPVNIPRSVTPTNRNDPESSAVFGLRGPKNPESNANFVSKIREIREKHQKQRDDQKQRVEESKNERLEKIEELRDILRQQNMPPPKSYEKLDLDSSDDEDEEDKRIDESAPEPKKEEKPISQPPPQSEEEEELNVQAAKEIQEEEDYCNIINEMQQIVEGEVLPENDENVAPEPRRQEGGSSTKDLDLPFNKVNFICLWPN